MRRGGLGLSLSDRRDRENTYNLQELTVVRIRFCRHSEWYPKNDIDQLHLPTIDYDVPILDYCIAGAKFIKQKADR